MPVSSTVGIIYPPPEVRSIVDKTAAFVARNGPEFEEKIRLNELGNSKFNFLNNNDPYHAYYQHKVKEIQEGKGPDVPAPPSQLNAASGNQAATSSSATNSMQKLTLSAKAQDTQSRIIEQIIIPKEPPPEFEFIADAPSVQPLDIDIIKLTAQFVARNGKPFLTGLITREQRNPLFDFLKPQHSYFNYFTRLVEHYTKILLPSKDIVERLRKEIENRYNVLKDVMYRVEWERIQQREKAKQDELAERERVAYAQVDWHDFVVVETVDYQPNEIGNFPPPTTPEDVGARVIALERFEGSGGTDIAGRLLMERIIDDESRVELSQLSKQIEEAESADKNVDEVAMDEDSDDEQQQKTKAKPAANEAVTLPKYDLPLPPNPDNVIIRKDYNPKQKQVTVSSQPKVDYFKSPITGELIPASSMSEHMRISMLDPRWTEQRQKEKKEREEQEEVLASGMNIEKNLKRLAEYRSDMFGSGADEALIGRKVGDEEKERDDTIDWDGQNSGDKGSKRTLTGIALEEQIKAIHQSQGIADDDAASKIGPKITQIISQPGVIQQKPSNQPLGYKIMGAPLNLPEPTLVKPPLPPSYMSQPPPMPIQTQLPPMQLHNIPPIQPIQPPVVVPPVFEEPIAKRQKTEDQLIPEAQYLAENESKGPITFHVQVPVVPEKPEWNLNGQNISLTMPLTETIATIKNKLLEILSMPIAKQKLQYESIFVKDTNSLAFYNMSSESVVHLQLKERGGRKK